MGATSRTLLIAAILLVAVGSTFLEKEFAGRPPPDPGDPAPLTGLSILADAPPAASTTYRVREGDTLRGIARRVYGSPEHHDLIRTLDRRRPGVIREGDLLLVPGLVPPRVEERPYVVREGDSLYTISEKVLGDGMLWRSIYDDNRDKLESPGALRAGQVLIIREEL